MGVPVLRYRRSPDGVTGSPAARRPAAREARHEVSRRAWESWCSDIGEGVPMTSLGVPVTSPGLGVPLRPRSPAAKCPAAKESRRAAPGSPAARAPRRAWESRREGAAPRPGSPGAPMSEESR